DPGWRLEELEAARALVPDPQNSAARVAAARKLFPAGWPNRDLYKALENLPPERDLGAAPAELLRARLARARSALEVARTVADLPAGRFEIAWGDDLFSMRLDDIIDSRGVARLLAYDAALRAHDGDADGALTSCQAIVNTGRAIGDAPLILA